MPKEQNKKDPDWQPQKLSDLSYFSQQFIPLDTILYYPTKTIVEEVVYKDFLKTDLPPMTELYFSKQKAEIKTEKLKNNEKEEDDE